jgi:hypothetical protein
MASNKKRKTQIPIVMSGVDAVYSETQNILEMTQPNPNFINATASVKGSTVSTEMGFIEKPIKPTPPPIIQKIKAAIQPNPAISHIPHITYTPPTITATTTTANNSGSTTPTLSKSSSSSTPPAQTKKSSSSSNSSGSSSSTVKKSTPTPPKNPNPNQTGYYTNGGLLYYDGVPYTGTYNDIQFQNGIAEISHINLGGEMITGINQTANAPPLSGTTISNPLP